MNDGYLAAIFDSRGYIVTGKRGPRIYVTLRVANKGLADELAEEFGVKVQVDRAEDNEFRARDSYKVTLGSKASILKLCNAIEPHTIKRPVVRALRDCAHGMYHNRDKDERKELVRYIRQVEQRWLDSG